MGESALPVGVRCGVPECLCPISASAEEIGSHVILLSRPGVDRFTVVVFIIIVSTGALGG